MGLCPQGALRRTWCKAHPGKKEGQAHSARYRFPRCLGQVFPALQGLTEILECLLSRHATVVL